MNVGVIAAEMDSSNGWAQMSVSIVSALRQLGVNTRIVAAEGTDADFPILPRLALSKRGILARQLRSLPQVRRALAECDVIHTLVEPFAPLGVLTAGTRPHIMTAAGTYAALPLMRGFPVGRLYRWAFERSSTVCISRYTQTVLARAAPRSASVVIRNGVDAEGLAASAAGLEPFPKAGPVVLFVGAVKERKGTAHLVRAMKQVHSQHPTATCIVAGSLKSEPAYVEALRTEISDLGISDVVRIMGHVDRDDLLRWYKTADVLVVPSMNAGWRFEGFGLIYLEAGAFGVPAIGTRECGASDAIDEGETGLLVSQGRVDAELPAAILRVLNDDDLRKKMGRANREKAEHMTWRSVAHQYIDLYEARLKL